MLRHTLFPHFIVCHQCLSTSLSCKLPQSHSNKLLKFAQETCFYEKDTNGSEKLRSSSMCATCLESCMCGSDQRGNVPVSQTLKHILIFISCKSNLYILKKSQLGAGIKKPDSYSTFQRNYRATRHLKTTDLYILHQIQILQVYSLFFLASRMQQPIFYIGRMLYFVNSFTAMYLQNNPDPANIMPNQGTQKLKRIF